MDEAKKQYFIFAIIVTVVVSLVINFFLYGNVQGPVIGGFPLTVAGVEGITAFLYRIINTVVTSLILVVPVYYGIMWLVTRGGGEY